MTQNHLNEMYLLVIALTALAYYGHRGNIVRLVHGNERKTYLSKTRKF
jgi:glycerol-3-phosphate acyltransferase PlsY